MANTAASMMMTAAIAWFLIWLHFLDYVLLYSFRFKYQNQVRQGQRQGEPFP